MNWFLYALVHLIFCFFAGTFFGYHLCRRHIDLQNTQGEKETYCHGFEDGIYYAIDEYRPDLFNIEMAETCYKEYKAIKHGPQKH